ncbi:(2Fe-2S)-binding protein [Candidatus Xianfuyuplasma coldseepsis]|uniref:2Fe-2S iron-sulfur cluster binding domain-containing protein n=1 Tax=Candidatus Xianfuyuplasma coldseepsis TaxID=2782163 RepID=A0A7L7KNS9_9MOLU|nr:2Fe-2S iron-sulfur cluster-binding protein [Xianfuyuplasma coldseepsis]QMS84411.1 2Fe-2S iron-sulfur cluster binding domain-containing protein [Xianfuyuplasma coldseepsis]
MKVTFILNHQEETWDVHPNDYLLDSLRTHHIVSVKRGCDTTSCGVCTVLLNGKAVPSCSILSASIDGKEVVTVEGIAKEAERLSEFMGHNGADQCGYCNPSLALSVHALQQENPHPSDADIRAFLVGNLCRCTGYHGQQEAILHYLEDDQ